MRPRTALQARPSAAASAAATAIPPPDQGRNPQREDEHGNDERLRRVHRRGATTARSLLRGELLQLLLELLDRLWIELPQLLLQLLNRLRVQLPQLLLQLLEHLRVDLLQLLLELLQLL